MLFTSSSSQLTAVAAQYGAAVMVSEKLLFHSSSPLRSHNKLHIQRQLLLNHLIFYTQAYDLCHIHHYQCSMVAVLRKMFVAKFPSLTRLMIISLVMKDTLEAA